MTEQWYIKTRNGKRGPYTKQQLQRYIDAGAIRPNAGIGDGEGSWMAAGSIQGLSFPGGTPNKFSANGRNGKSVHEDIEVDSRDLGPELVERLKAFEERAAEIEKANSEVEAKARTVLEREDELLDRIADLESKESELQEFEIKLQERQNSLDSMDEELQGQLEQLAEEQGELRQLRAKIELQQEEQDQEQTQSVGRIQKLNDQISESSDQVLKLEQELSESQAAETKHLQTIDSLQAEISESKQALEQAAAQIEAVEDESAKRISDLDVRLEELVNRLNQRDEEIETTKQELKRCQTNLEEKTRLLQQQENTWNTRLSDQELEIECQKEEVAQWRQQAEFLQESLATGNASQADAAESIAKLQRELASYREQLKEKEHQLDTLTTELESRGSATGIASLSDPDAWHDQESSSDVMLDEKRKLLQDFATRQASLSRREAELIRREEELTERELNISQFGRPDESSGQSHGSQKTLAQRVADNRSTREDADSEVPVEKLAVANDGSDQSLPTASPTPRTSPKTNRFFAAEPVLEEQDYVGPHEDSSLSAQPRLAGWPQPKQLDGKTNGNGHPNGAKSSILTPLGSHRREIYDERFGPCHQFLEDSDPNMKVDVSVHQPFGARDFTTLVTSGMSDYPIPMPSGQRSVRAELLLYVAHVDDLAIQVIRAAAKVPYRLKQGLTIGSAYSLSDSGIGFSGFPLQDCAYMLPIVEADSRPIPAKEIIGNSIQLFWLVTISDAERKLIETNGIHRFLSLLEKNNHAVFFDPTRECYVKRKSWFRR